MEEEAIRTRSSEPLRPRVMRRPAREDSGEALTGARAGWAIEPRKCVHSRAPTLYASAEGHTRTVDINRETMRGPARSETPSMHGNISHGSREIPRLSAAGWRQTARGSPRAIA